jgi:hypothetical protein
MIAARTASRVPKIGRRVPRLVALIAIAGLVSCSNEPTKPRAYSVTGHVTLTGYLVDDGGGFTGTRVVGDADGVAVELVFGTRVVARAATVDGVYRFSGVKPGGYVVQTHPVSIVTDYTEDVTVVNSDLAIADTLRLASVGDLTPTPNPIGSGSRIYFSIPDTQYVDVQVRNMAGEPVKTLLLGDLPGGIQHAFWDGRDAQGAIVPGEVFWVTFDSGSDHRAHLVFK